MLGFKKYFSIVKFKQRKDIIGKMINDFNYQLRTFGAFRMCTLTFFFRFNTLDDFHAMSFKVTINIQTIIYIYI